MANPVLSSDPTALLKATDTQIEEVAMELMIGYCMRIATNKMIKAAKREDWAKLGLKVKAICDLRYGRPVANPTTDANNKTQPE